MIKILFLFTILSMTSTIKASNEPDPQEATAELPPTETPAEPEVNTPEHPDPFAQMKPEEELQDLITRDEEELQRLRAEIKNYKSENPRATGQEVLDHQIRTNYRMYTIKTRIAHHKWRAEHPLPPVAAPTDSPQTPAAPPAKKAPAKPAKPAAPKKKAK